MPRYLTLNFLIYGRETLHAELGDKTPWEGGKFLIWLLCTVPNIPLVDVADC